MNREAHTVYLVRRRLRYTRRMRQEFGFGWLYAWQLAGLNQRIALEIVAEMRAERESFEASVLHDLDLLEVVA